MESPNRAAAPNEQASANGSASPPPAQHASLASNLAWRAVANWSSQLVSWASLLVVVRLLSPADFGLVGMSVALYWYLRFLGAFGITPTVVRHRDLDDETLAQLNSMGVIFGIGSFLLACIFVWPVAIFFKTRRLIPVALVTCLSLIPLGFRSVPEGIMNQRMRLKSLSFLEALRDVMSAVLTVTLAWLGFHYWALVLGNLVSEIARTVIILGVQRHRFARPRLSVIRGPLLFSWRMLVSGFAWSTYNTLDNVTAGRVLGQTALGLYGMAWNLANTPLEKIVSLVTTLIPAYLSRVQNDMAALRRYVISLTEVIALATFPACLGLALVSRDAVPLIMGAKWANMVPPLEILSIYAAFRSIVALLPKVLTAVGNARFVMRVEVSGLVIMPIAFWIGSHWGIRGIAYGWVAAYPLVALPHYWKTFATIHLSFRDYFRCLRPAIDASLAMIIAVLAFRRYTPTGLQVVARLSCEILIGAGVYVAVLALMHRPRLNYFVETVRKMRGGKKAEPQPALA